MSDSGSASSPAGRVWNPATHLAVGARAAASSAAEPASGGAAVARPCANFRGEITLITIFPSSFGLSSSTVAACPAYGTARITISPARAAALFMSPVTLPVVGLVSNPAPRRPSIIDPMAVAAEEALPASREPITISCPASANRTARPLPSGPVPPMRPIVCFRDILPWFEWFLILDTNLMPWLD